jgi:hypothetical protein
MKLIRLVEIPIYVSLASCNTPSPFRFFEVPSFFHGIPANFVDREDSWIRNGKSDNNNN